MSSSTALQQYQAEVVINNDTGASYLSQAALARICKQESTVIRRHLRGDNFEGKTAEVLTPGGLQGVTLYAEDAIASCIVRFNPELAKQLLQLGVRTLLHKLAGWKPQQEPKPMTGDELALWTVTNVIETKKRLQATEAKVERLEAFAPHADHYTVTAYCNLNPDVVKPKSFPAAGKAIAALSRSLGYEIKSVSDVKYGSCNAYHTDVLKQYFGDNTL